MKILATIGATALLVVLGSALPAFAQDHPEEEKPAQHEEQAKPAQHEEQAKPEQQEEKAKPAEHQEEAKSAQQEEKAKPEPKEQAKPAQHEEQPKQAKQQQEPKPEKQEAAKPAQHAEQAKPAKQQQAKTEKPEQSAKPAEHTQQAKQQSEQTTHAKTFKQEDSKQVAQAQNNHNASQQHNGAPQRTAAETQHQHSEPALRLSARGEGRIPDDHFRSYFGREHVFRIGDPRMEGGYSRFQYGGYWFGFVQPWPVAWYYTDDVYVDYIDGGYYLYNPYYPGSRVLISVVI
ncbi:MAG: hypothetical protein WA823_11215 [Candidatus Acidiferrales bacterium]